MEDFVELLGFDTVYEICVLYDLSGVLDLLNSDPLFYFFQAFLISRFDPDIAVFSSSLPHLSV